DGEAHPHSAVQRGALPRADGAAPRGRVLFALTGESAGPEIAIVLAASRLDGRAPQTLAGLFALACALMPAAATAQPSKLESAYVVLGPQGALARVIVADAVRCPSISIDGSEQAMKVRALPDAAFPVLVCELPLTAGAKSAHIAGVENVSLPVVKPALTSVAALCGPGCRLKAAHPPARSDDQQEL